MHQLTIWLMWVLMTIIVTWTEKIDSSWMNDWLHMVLKAATFVLSTFLALLTHTEEPTISARVIPYVFPSKPGDELFPCVYFTASIYLPGCCLCNSLTPRISISSLWLALGIVFPCRLCPTGIKLQEEWQILWTSCRAFTWFTIAIITNALAIAIITNALINQAGSYYIITNSYYIWDKSQLYPITHMISLLLYLTSAWTQSSVITTLSSL